MSDEKRIQFNCCECGSNRLGYKKYAKCITPVSLQEKGNVEYGSSAIDEDDYLCADDGFICLNCKTRIEHCGSRIKTEKELTGYLTMDPEVREKEEAEYGEYISTQIYAQEQKEKEQASMLATMDILGK